MLSRVESALERLGQAVARLEYAGAERLDALIAGGGDQAQVQHLSAELAAMRANYEELQLTSQTASGRIDAAIGRLRAVLEA
ncbi:hypothetical protein ACM64Y_03280 [Novispirillum sp. DQ9]|uniref:hypothetical protein n=1 Tax=Novispirillum sp. DQ9 TaxID=3398612 RepID=UPI003C7E317C